MPLWGWICAAYIIVIALWLIRCWPRPTCPRCYYPLHHCECYQESGDGPHVERPLRIIEGGRR